MKSIRRLVDEYFFKQMFQTIQTKNRLTYTKENKLGLDAYEMFNTWNKNPYTLLFEESNKIKTHCEDL